MRERGGAQRIITNRIGIYIYILKEIKIMGPFVDPFVTRAVFLKAVRSLEKQQTI